ncbi:MAG: cell surface protein SprA [Prevotellaceae bacterium]|jgi:cell surface protein SprA|nr:cell surface protein SprA [Prevotellaceae bacterium]
MKLIIWKDITGCCMFKQNIIVRIRFFITAVFLVAGVSTSAQTQSSQQFNQLSQYDEDVVRYDPDTDSYLYFRKGEEKDGKPYKVLSKKEYDKEAITKQIGNGWLKKREESAKSALNEKGGFSPSFRRSVNNKAFETVFGGKDISIDFNGSIDVLLGIKSTYIDNPITPPPYRRTTTPSFDTRYQLNLTGNIGERIKLKFTFDPNSTFDFETNLNIGYKGGEDDILQNIELGNISMPVSNSLITGSRSLFGGRADLRFGKLDLTLVASQQKGESKTLEFKGGAQSQDFEIRADEYRANQYFFLSQYFRDNFEPALSQRPVITSGVNITKLEVWVTNKLGTINESNNNHRNIVAFMDLAEPSKIYNKIPEFGSNSSSGYTSNDANKLYFQMTSIYNVRNFSEIASSLQPLTGRDFMSGKDYEKLERARKLRPDEYFFNPQLGYIGLNMPLYQDEVLAVAFEYTLNGRTYQVGELSTAGSTGSDSTLVVKLLKGTILTPRLPTWNLMMKNVYELGDAYQLKTSSFEMNILYEDSQIGTAVPYISEGPIDKQPLINVLGLDRTNQNGDAYPDGIFDFMQGITVDTRTNARIIFPVLEPFGRYLEKQFKGDPSASKYVYKELYDSTLTKAKEIAGKNRFVLKGSYEAEMRGVISLGATNVAEGSVTVTAGGTVLTENVDYQVNYMMGTVIIINPGYLNSGVPISVRLENRNTYNLQTKTMLGANMDYRFSEKFKIGATLLHLSQKPMTQKVAYGSDPVSNTIWGLNTGYSSESKVLTDLLAGLPFINSNAKSRIDFRAEVANLISGQPRGIKGKIFIDDFEGSKSALDLRNYIAWTLASVPQGQDDLFPEASEHNKVTSGYNRAKLAWYSIDPELLRRSSSTPSYYIQNPAKFQENFLVCNIPVWDIYPNRQLPEGTPYEIQTLNLNYYPNERGPYNYDNVNIDGKGFLRNSKNRWAGIMRSLAITDLETANYDYIEFWMMDPFTYQPRSNGGDFYINLGTLSEDILRDGYKSHEQGIPYPFDTTKMIKTAWGYVPKTSALVNTFDNDGKSRVARDIGLDGMNSELETFFFASFLRDIQGIVTDQTAREKLLHDPSSDDFLYYRDPVHDQRRSTIMERYKDFNNPEKNSSNADVGSNSQVYSLNPDMEDINRDNTMEESESYFQYHIRMKPNMQIGENFIADIIEKDSIFPNAGKQHTRWYLFRVPLNGYHKTIGAISDFKSIRFMRMFMRNFEDTTVMRFASLELVRSEWRKFNYSLLDGQESLATPESAGSTFEVSVVNIEESSQRIPVNYVLPPNTDRVIDINTIQERELNEQALQLMVKDLPDGDARAVYKTLAYDLRQYRRLQMDVHAEALVSDSYLQDDDLSLFMRIGSDLQSNYYEYEIPLKLTPHGFYADNQRHLVWREDNLLDINLSDFTELKAFRNANGASVNVMYERKQGSHTVRVRGNPNLGQVRTMMIGIRNPVKNDMPNDKSVPKSGVIWVNELRLTDFENRGGWAGTASLGMNLADIGNISISGNFATAGFGGLEQAQQDRNQEDVYRYDILSNLDFGRLFSQKIGLHLPVFFAISERFANPLYDPLSPDMKYRDAMNSLKTKAQRDSLRNLAQDYTRTRSFNVANMKIAPGGISPGGIINISNLSLNFAYNETFRRNVNIEQYLYKEYRGGLTYAYSIQPLYIEPFKKIGFLGSHWFSLIRDFNFNLVPNQFTFTTEMYRMYSERQNRNIAYPEAKLPFYFSKNFTWTRTYSLNWNLSRNLSFNYFATNAARIDEPEGMVNSRLDPAGYSRWKDSVWRNIFNFGRTVDFNHNFTLSWKVPFSKFKPLDWIDGSATYRGLFSWVAAPILAANDYGYVFDPGNTISNGRTINANLDPDFTKLYNKSKFLKSINDEFDRKKRPEMVETTFESKIYAMRANSKRTVNHGLGTENVTVSVIDEQGSTIRSASETVDKNRVSVTVATNIRAKILVKGKVPKKDNPAKHSAKLLTRMLMMVRSASISYTQTESSILPGFNKVPEFIGLTRSGYGLAPGLDFVMGGQATDFLLRAKNYGWITNDSTMINPYVMRKSVDLNIRIAVEPIKDLKIELTGFRNEVRDMTTYDIVNGSGLTTAVGSFSISTISLAGAFESYSSDNNYKSRTFDNFDRYRNTIAWRIAQQRQKVTGGAYNPGAGNFPEGYGKVSQEVVIPAFIAAYTGMSPSTVSTDIFRKIPLPNWTVTYNGLSRSELFKRFFRSGSIKHSYSSRYTVNAWQWNNDFVPDHYGYSWVQNQLGDYIPRNEVLNVSISEHFAPLFGLSLSWQNDLTTNFNINKDRTLGLSLSNNQLLEMKNTSYRFDLSYVFRKVPLIFKFGDTQKKTDTDLKLSAGYSYNNNQNFIRSLEETEQTTQISSGNRKTALNINADYTIYKGVVLKVFYNQDLNTPWVSAVSVSNTYFGFGLRVLFQ